MLGRLKQLGPVETPHRQPYGAGAPAFGEKRRSALCAEATTYTAVGAHPPYRAVNRKPSRGHHDTRVKGGTRRLLATMTMADAHV